INFRLGGSGAVGMILLDRALQRLEAFARVMEMDNGIGQPRARQINEQALEQPKGPARLVGLRLGLDRFKCLGAFNKNEGPPIFSLLISIKCLSVTSRDNGQT